MGEITVTDADSDELTQLEYLVVGGNEGGWFTIDPSSGEISTAAEIDREDGEMYTLIIEVCQYHL